MDPQTEKWRETELDFATNIEKQRPVDSAKNGLTDVKLDLSKSPQLELPLHLTKGAPLDMTMKWKDIQLELL